MGNFRKLLAASADLPLPDLAAVSDAKIRQKAQKEIDQVRKTFTRDQLLAGSEILLALSAATDFAGRDRQLFFARQAYYGWILGYVVEKGGTASGARPR